MQNRYHIQFFGLRTTVSVDTYLAELLALHLNRTPNTSEAHSAVRRWLQSRLPSRMERTEGGRQQTSLHARKLILETVADAELRNRHEQWQTREHAFQHDEGESRIG